MLKSWVASYPVGEPEFASQCIRCGKRLEKCPQHIEIPTILESAVEELKGPDLEKRVAIAKQIFKRRLESEKFKCRKDKSGI